MILFVYGFVGNLSLLFFFFLCVHFKQENQRPPVYNAEDYILSLKKFGRRTSGGTTAGGLKSIYDTSDDKLINNRSATLPVKHSSHK